MPLQRPTHKPVVWYKSFLYQAASWTTAGGWWRKVEFLPIGCIVINLEPPSGLVVRFYN